MMRDPRRSPVSAPALAAAARSGRRLLRRRRWPGLMMSVVVWLGAGAGVAPAQQPPAAPAAAPRVESLNLIITQSTEGELQPCGT